MRLKKTIRSLEQALKDKGVETARTKKALKNVAALMEKHNERQPLPIEPEIPKAAEILRLFNLLYDREHRHRIGRDGWTVADNLRWREEYAPPILARIEEKLNAVKTDPHVPADSDLMGAVKYALNEWEWGPAIFSRGDYNLDNNLIERMQRLVSLLRRNSLFFGSHKGGETAAMYLSLVVSCRLNGVNVMESALRTRTAD